MSVSPSRYSLHPNVATTALDTITWRSARRLQGNVSAERKSPNTHTHVHISSAVYIELHRHVVALSGGGDVCKLESLRKWPFIPVLILKR